MPHLWVFYSSGISGILCVLLDSRFIFNRYWFVFDSRFPCGLLLFFSNSRKDVDASLYWRRQKQEPQASPFALSDWNFSLLLSLYWNFHGGGFLVPRTRACCPYGVAELLTSIVLIQRCSQTLPRYFYPNLASTSVGSHSTAATNRRSRAHISYD